MLVYIVFSSRSAKHYMSKKNMRGGWSGFGMGKMRFNQFIIWSWWDSIKNLDSYYKTKFCLLQTPLSLINWLIKLVILFLQTFKTWLHPNCKSYFADPGKARGCSTNTFVIDWLIDSLIHSLSHPFPPTTVQRSHA